MTALLTSRKWYYQSFNTSRCFDEDSYWEFKSDGSVIDTWNFEGSSRFLGSSRNLTYTVSEDGKSIILISSGPNISTNTYNLTITSVNASELKFSINYYISGTPDNVILAKTALDCVF
ncbi:hypothetical protein [Pedobacter glucosidilyticus]|uniref:hypothetical protein n=1 Tax=Pedobacter glucosidilyticus TaxID=1122941 RepID=UPI00040304AD|nr:hypothetical protein [Pedobacter glucosidilyticus]